MEELHRRLKELSLNGESVTISIALATHLGLDHRQTYNRAEIARNVFQYLKSLPPETPFLGEKFTSFYKVSKLLKQHMFPVWPSPPQLIVSYNFHERRSCERK